MADLKNQVESAKRSDSRDQAITNFFSDRDKTKRGTSGLVQDTSEKLKEEVKVKSDLYESSQELVSLPDHVVPMSNFVFLSARRNKVIENGIYLPTAAFGKGSDTDIEVDFSPRQVVLAKGKFADQLEVGDEVILNMENFKHRLTENMAQKLNRDYEIKIPVEVIEGVSYLYVSERDVKYVANRKHS